MSKVTVKIYGQEYTISGERSEEEIRKIAEHVDEQMRTIGKVSQDKSTASLAVLAAVNISDAYFEASKEAETLKESNEKLQNDADYYMNMWEKSKKNSKTSKDNLGELQARIREDGETIKELKDKCGEYESSFFDLQMENIKLKNELEKLKGKQ